MANDIKTTDNEQGRKLNVAGGAYRIIISGKETDGNYAIIEMTVPIGAGPVPHSHPDFEEIFYVLEGEVNFKSESGNFLAQKGATVSIPKGGAIHNFKNISDQPAKLLCTVMPAGLDDFFIEVETLMNSNQSEGMDIKESIQLISEKYGQTLYSPNHLDL
ncbi:cupin domain-containing protein [Taibaiella lutea]|uniref:Cupin domain-containing protein n=1 Tax=Taibaiella lutea TaxID=2608001 RepID=A0A5M6CMW7_9BACT|nr:cupin domain-containing protein [Taibaiella lutea]KAA5536393.1 cupin domain-containing protein [Taibaiella lutea]